jgi:hypothetical protein
MRFTRSFGFPTAVATALLAAIFFAPAVRGQTTLTLAGGHPCLAATDTTLRVRVNLTGATSIINSGQFFLAYDNTVLGFVSAQPGDPPFVLEILESVDQTQGTIDYLVSAPFGSNGTMQDTTMAVLTFNVIGERCAGAPLVWFRTHTPPTRLATNMPGQTFTPALVDLAPIAIDRTGPVITCPADISAPADAGGCTFTSGPIASPPVTDNCDPAPTISGARGDGHPFTDPFPAGSTAITWTAHDACGNTSTCVQHVLVSGVNLVEVTVEFPGLDPGPITRCISLDLAECGGSGHAHADQVLTFTGGVATGTVPVPCGHYTCAGARDTLHSLRRTDSSFHVDGTHYSASFTGARALRGGNLNADGFIDIFDFGAYVGAFAATYGSGDTTCATPVPHADLSGDGVVSMPDFTFIQINFLATDDAPCCPPITPLHRGGGGGGGNGGGGSPRASISLAEARAMGLDLSRSDLNHDGVVDARDLVIFARHGVCPADWNGDGRLGVPDVLAFLASFSAGDADADGDGSTSVRDVLAFLTDYAGGCP